MKNWKESTISLKISTNSIYDQIVPISKSIFDQLDFILRKADVHINSEVYS